VGGIPVGLDQAFIFNKVEDTLVGGEVAHNNAAAVAAVVVEVDIVVVDRNRAVGVAEAAGAAQRPEPIHNWSLFDPCNYCRFDYWDCSWLAHHRHIVVAAASELVPQKDPLLLLLHSQRQMDQTRRREAVEPTQAAEMNHSSAVVVAVVADSMVAVVRGLVETGSLHSIGQVVLEAGVDIVAADIVAADIAAADTGTVVEAAAAAAEEVAVERPRHNYHRVVDLGIQQAAAAAAAAADPPDPKDPDPWSCWT
jgi:hypothetical protein